jgi:hypothetical protein
MISKTFEAKRTPPHKQAHLTAFSIASPGMLEIVHLLHHSVETGKTSS